MRQVTILAATAMVVGSLPTGALAQAQSKPAPAVQAPAASVCAKLMADYERTSKNLANNLASSVTDNSAPRATLRAMEDANDLATAKMALDLMRDNRCTLPKHVPSASRYALSALKCANARYGAKAGETPAECKREDWKPETE
ncbi:MAG TPA: hypothetical protein VM662_14060 [Sphingomonas sp.]|nr:hypothetical protein [Sphingomonas sp.]